MFFTWQWRPQRDRGADASPLTGPCRGTRFPVRPRLEALETRTLLTVIVPLAFSSNHAVAQSAPTTQSIDYGFAVDQDSRLTAHLSSSGARLSLLGVEGQILVQSDGQPGQGGVIDLHLAAGDHYALEVTPLGGSPVSWTLGATLLSAGQPLQPALVDGDPYGVVADLNGDGIPDVVTTNLSTNDISVLLGRGDGTFAPPVRYPVGQNPRGVAVADLNGDGIPDLIVTDQGQGSLTVLYGRGDGTFGNATTLPFFGFPDSVVTGDFTGNGRTDLAVTDVALNRVVLLYRLPGGGWSAPVSVPVGRSPTRIVAVDFNGDGRLDLATVNSASNTVSVLMNNGDGTFRRTDLSVGADPTSLTVADLEGNGHKDLITSNQAGGTMCILEGHGDGTFAAARSLAPGPAPIGVAVADFNGDGIPDLAVTDAATGILTVYPGLGGGALGPPQQTSLGCTSAFLAAADLTGNGHIDLVYGSLGTFDVRVALGRGDGTFLTPAPTEQAAGIQAIASGDLNHDGRTDLVTANAGTSDVEVLLGQGDGTFRSAGRYSTGGVPIAVALGDFEHDGNLDLVLGYYNLPEISVSRGLGDGTFGPPVFYPIGGFCDAIATGDFSGDGNLDLALANATANSVVVLRGDGHGGFTPGGTAPTGAVPRALVAGDFNGDGILDLATADSVSGTVSVLLGRGDGTFAPARRLAVGGVPLALVAADFNGDGRTDLAVSDSVSGNVVVFLNQGGENFNPGVSYPSGPGATGLAVGPFTGSSAADLAVANSNDDSITLLSNNGDGTFRRARKLTSSRTPQALLSVDLAGRSAVARLSESGVVLGSPDSESRATAHPALVAANFGNSEVDVFPIGPGGVVQTPLTTPVAQGAAQLVSADLNGDGFPDLVTANFERGTITVQLGNGDLGFSSTEIPAGKGPSAVAVGDFNHDGRPDLAVADFLSDTVTILLGRGDGTFLPAQVIPVGSRPDALAVGDFWGDGTLDLAVADYGSGDVTLLRGRGDGSFQPVGRYPVGAGPVSLTAADLEGDGHTDLVVCNELGRSVSILSASNGTFHPGPTLKLPASLAGASGWWAAGPTSAAVADFNGDGHLDIAVACPTGNLVQVWLGTGSGFVPGATLTVPGEPISVVAGDFNGDGRADLAVASFQTGRVSLWLGQGDGSFRAGKSWVVGAYPVSLLATNMEHSDGQDDPLDLVSASGVGLPVTLLIGLGDGTFRDASDSTYSVRTVPLVGDLTGARRQDVAVLDQRGRLLVRLGVPDSPGDFAPPLVLGSQGNRDLALVSVGAALDLVAIDAHDNGLTFWEWDRASRQFRVRMQLPVPDALPVRLLAADLNGDGRQDLVVATASRVLLLYRQAADGSFVLDSRAALESAPADLTTITLAGALHPAIAVVDAWAGNLQVVALGPAGHLGTELRYRAGTSDTASASAARVRSADVPVAVASAGVGESGSQHLVIVDRNDDRLSLLRPDPWGGLFDAVSPDALRTGLQPRALATGDFNGDGITDLAVLNGDGTLSIFLGDGQGGYTERVARGPDGTPLRASAGNDPVGLAVADLGGDEKLDLVIGNKAGDILLLLGNGDGTFRPYERIDARTRLAVAGRNQASAPELVLASRESDLLHVVSPDSVQTFTQGRKDGILAPGDVKLADLEGNGLLDMVVANGGTNSVLVYRGLPGGGFASPLSFYTGTDPVGVTIADLEGDGLPDLIVANQGSNDVSILLGTRVGGTWTLTPGPRLRVGAGPVATAVVDVDGTGTPDLLVSCSQANAVYLLKAMGKGFFDDQHPVVFPTGGDPTALAVGHFTSPERLDLVSLDTGSGALSLFPGMSTAAVQIPFGDDPVALLQGDFQHNGFDDLVVVGHQDGMLTLVLGSEAGLRVAARQWRADLPHPDDIALGSLTDGELTVWVAGGGVNTFGQVLFDLQDAAPGSISGPSPGSPSGLPPMLQPEPVESPSVPPRSGVPVTELTSNTESPLEAIPTVVLGERDSTQRATPTVDNTVIARAAQKDSLLALGGEEDNADVPGQELGNEGGGSHAERGSQGEGRGEDTRPVVPSRRDALQLGLDELPFERRLWEHPFSGEEMFRDWLPRDPLGPTSWEDQRAGEDATEGTRPDPAPLIMQKQLHGTVGDQPEEGGADQSPVPPRADTTPPAARPLSVASADDRRGAGLPAVLSVALGVLGGWLREQTQRWALAETIEGEKRRKAR